MDVARKCCLMLTSKYERFIFDADFIIPVPSFWTRTLRRGFNPADIIAIELSKNLNIPLDLKALKRIRKTEYQKNKTKVEREKNIENAFLCEGNIRGKKILLIDDVMTTGTTLNECAKALKMAGASVVVGLTIASTKALK
ncbi:hypothetical protein FACS1894113_5610 [Alphaproteobacteria bacterium]|nr:hypothetical protein FACS1894113_5610 [Alphaproteobacteria bacterium]